MMIRLRHGRRKSSVQLIRTAYDPVRGRGGQTVIARLPASADTLPPDVSACLTDAERAQVEAWLAPRRERRAVLLADYTAADLSACADKLKLTASTPDGLDAARAAAEKARVGVAIRDLLRALYGDAVRVVVRRQVASRSAGAGEVGRP